MEFLKQKPPQEKLKSAEAIRGIVLFLLIFGIAFLFVKTSVSLFSAAPSEIFTQESLIRLVYPAVLLSLFTVLLMILDATSSVATILIVDFLLGIEFFFILSPREDLFGLIGITIFILSLFFGAISIKNILDRFTKISFTSILRLSWKWLSVGLIGLMLFSLFVSGTSYKIFPLSEGLFVKILKSSTPITQAFLPMISFDKSFKENVSALATSGKIIQIPGIPQDIQNMLVGQSVDEQIKNLNQSYKLTLTGKEPLSKVLYAVIKSFYESKKGEQLVMYFLGYLVLVLFILKFIFWIIGIVCMIIGFILIKILRTAGLFKIAPATTTKETIVI